MAYMSETVFTHKSCPEHAEIYITFQIKNIQIGLLQ